MASFKENFVILFYDHDEEKIFNALFVKSMSPHVITELENVKDNFTYQRFSNLMFTDDVVFKRIELPKLSEDLIIKHDVYLIFKDVKKIFGVLKNFKYFVYRKTTAVVENNVMLFEPVDRVFNDYLFFGLNLREKT